MYSFSKQRRERRAAIAKNLESLHPASLDVIRYKKGESEGTISHQDVYAVFGTAICIVNDENVGRLRVVNFEMPESFSIGEFIILDPLYMHKVTKLFFGLLKLDSTTSSSLSLLPNFGAKF